MGQNNIDYADLIKEIEEYIGIFTLDPEYDSLYEQGAYMIATGVSDIIRDYKEGKKK